MCERSVIFLKQKFILILSVFMLTYVASDVYRQDKSVFALSEKEYALGGQTVGIKLYSKGIMCVDFEDTEYPNPALAAGLKKGDIILSAGEREISDTDSFVEAVKEAGETVQVVYDRNGKIKETTITPETDAYGNKRVGMWVRDSVAGVGTITFYSEEDGQVVTLGHPVTDSDTGRSFTVGKGYITDCDILSVEKSKRGAPGEIIGQFKEDEKIYGQIRANTENGLYADIKDIPEGEAEYMRIAAVNDVHDGGALLYTDVAGDGVKGYSVNIKRLFSGGKNDMTVQISDERLISVTGGIVQGMSGSPIVQDGKIIGALTHVFLDDPKSGYAVYAQQMTKTAEKIKENEK